MNEKPLSSDTSSICERLDNSNCHQRRDAGSAVVDNNGNGNEKPHRFIHSVSIIVEPVLEDVLSESDQLAFDEANDTTRYKDSQSPVVLLENYDLSGA